MARSAARVELSKSLHTSARRTHPPAGRIGIHSRKPWRPSIPSPHSSAGCCSGTSCKIFVVKLATG